MNRLEVLRQSLPSYAKDLKLNLQSVLKDGSLTEEQRLGVALAAATSARYEPLREALNDLLDSPEVTEDAAAAAALMAMNNVYYRFRHFMEGAYDQKPARLRMTRLAQVKSTKANFELFSLAVSAINGCELCVRAHEAALKKEGVTEEMIHDAVRIASVIQAVAVTLEQKDPALARAA